MPELRRLHGPTAGTGIGPYSGDDDWWCSRCGYEAIDLDNATEYALSFADFIGEGIVGLRWERMCKDAVDGRPVDPFLLARQMGRYFNPYCRNGGYDDLEGPFHLVCELVDNISSGRFTWCYNDDPWSRWPWSDEATPVVAQMMTAALVASGTAIVDALGDDAPAYDPNHGPSIEAALASAPAGDEWARAAARHAAFGAPHPTRTGTAVPEAVLAVLIGELHAGSDRLGPSVRDAGRQVLIALAAAGYSLVEVR